MRLFIVFALFVLPYVTKAADTAGPVGKFHLTTAKPCSSFNNDGVKLDFKLENVDDGKKALSMVIEIPEDIDDTFKLKLVIDKYDQGAWVLRYYQTTGVLLDLIEKYIPVVYDNVLEKLSPTFDKEKKLIPAGKYELKKFQDVESSISLPKIFYGQLRMTFDVTKANEEQFICVVAEAKSEP